MLQQPGEEPDPLATVTASVFIDNLQGRIGTCTIRAYILVSMRRDYNYRSTRPRTHPRPLTRVSPARPRQTEALRNGREVHKCTRCLTLQNVKLRTSDNLQEAHKAWGAPANFRASARLGSGLRRTTVNVERLTCPWPCSRR